MRQRHNTLQQRGFTLVELMLAVAFIGGLLVVVALVTMQVMSLYNRGLTIKGVNEVSRTIVRDVQQSISSTDYFRVQYVDKNDPKKFHSATDLKTASENNVDYYANDAGGRLCTGTYSYVWNTGEAFETAHGTIFNPPRDEYGHSTARYQIQYMRSQDTPPEPIRFLKVRDIAKDLCRVATDASPSDVIDAGRFVNTKINKENFTNVFGSGNEELVLYHFRIMTPLTPMVDSTKERLTAVSTFYHISMIIGTQHGDEGDDGLDADSTSGILTSNKVCKPPAEAKVNQSEYCAINKIEFVARTGRIGN